MDKSPIVTLNGLNTVYTDLLKRIEALGNIYHIKGSYKTLEELIDGVTEATEGDAYNVVNDRLDKDPTDRDVEDDIHPWIENCFSTVQMRKDELIDYIRDFYMVRYM